MNKKQEERYKFYLDYENKFWELHWNLTDLQERVDELINDTISQIYKQITEVKVIAERINHNGLKETTNNFEEKILKLHETLFVTTLQKYELLLNYVDDCITMVSHRKDMCLQYGVEKVTQPELDEMDKEIAEVFQGLKKQTIDQIHKFNVVYDAVEDVSTSFDSLYKEVISICGPANANSQQSDSGRED